MTVHIHHSSGKTICVPSDITLGALVQLLNAQCGSSATHECTIGTGQHVHPTEPQWGPPWPEADFSGNVTL